MLTPEPAQAKANRAVISLEVLQSWSEGRADWMGLGGTGLD